MKRGALTAFLLLGCGSTGGGSSGDADSDTDTDTGTDTGSDTETCELPCDCVDCGHGVCVNVAGDAACQCDENYVPAPGPTCIATSVDDPDGYCEENEIRCLVIEFDARTDDCGEDECVVAWTETFELVADMWLYRVTTSGTGGTGCDCAEDATVQWLVDGECVASGEGLAGEFVYAQAGLPETSADLGRSLETGIHSLRGFRAAGCGSVDVDFVRLLLSPANP